jgi:hypothetical protein
MAARMQGTRLGRVHGGSEACRIQCGEHSSGILVDHSQQSASWGFWDPPPAFPVLGRLSLQVLLRRERVLTQKEVAEQTGLVPEPVSNYELDKLRLNAEIIVRFAEVLA